jgi:hypothetical protein
MNPQIEIDLERDSEDDIAAKLDILRTKIIRRQTKAFTRAEAMSKLGKRVRLKKKIPGLLPGEHHAVVVAVKYSHAGYAVVIKLELPPLVSLPELSDFMLVPVLKSAYQSCLSEEGEDA